MWTGLLGCKDSGESCTNRLSHCALQMRSFCVGYLRSCGQAASLETCFVVHFILALNSSSSQFYEAVAMVQELHLCRYICIDSTPLSALVRGEICPTAFTSIGLREYVSVVGVVNGIFIIYCCTQLTLESKSVVLFVVYVSLLRNLY